LENTEDNKFRILIIYAKKKLDDYAIYCNKRDSIFSEQKNHRHCFFRRQCTDFPVQITLINKDGTQEERKLHTATITDNLGNFKFDELKNGKYILEINEQDFQNFISPEIILNDQNPNSEQKIFLKKQKAKELEEVKISVKIPFVTQKIDRTVINPEALIANAGGTAFDVLNNSPGIMIDENAAIRMKGKSGVTILVDDKPLYLSGSELENYLRSLPAYQLNKLN
jgi:hypothetical protein